MRKRRENESEKERERKGEKKREATVVIQFILLCQEGKFDFWNT